MPKVILVTGTSSGIGLATAVHLAKEGEFVYASMRDLGRKGRLEQAAQGAALRVVGLDVTDDESVRAGVQLVLDEEGRIDVLINNAGYGLRGPVETVNIDEAKAVFEVNLFGLIRMTQAVLPAMRRQNRGQIINISSVAGLRGRPDSDLYNASKFSVEGLSEAMAPTLAQWNIKVSIVEPGPVSTDFQTRSLKRGSRKLDGDPYQHTIDVMKTHLAGMFKNAQDPSDIAKLLSSIIHSEQPHFRYQTSEGARRVAEKTLVDPTGDASAAEMTDLLERH